MTSENLETRNVLDRLFLSGRVLSHNEVIGVFSLRTIDIVSQKDDIQIPLHQWLMNKGIACWDWERKNCSHLASRWISSDGERVSFRPTNINLSTWYEPEIDKASLVEFMIYLDLYTFVSYDQSHVIEPEDGILAWHDQETGLMWDSARMINGRKSGSRYPNSILNPSNYAGYSDWRLPTLMELRTLVCEKISRGKHIKPPLSAMTLGPIWTRSTEDDKYAFDFSNLETLIDDYYKDNNVYAYDLCVRGNVTAYLEPWINSVLDWALKHDVQLPLNAIDLKNTRKLKIISNKYLKIQSIPAELKLLTALEEILIHADANIIPKFIWQYPNLKRLKVSVTGDLLKVEISSSISYLELDGAITNLPDCLARLPLLKSIFLKTRSSLKYNVKARVFLQDFVRQGGNLSLGSYMNYEDYGLRRHPATNLVEVIDII